MQINKLKPSTAIFCFFAALWSESQGAEQVAEIFFPDIVLEKKLQASKLESLETAFENTQTDNAKVVNEFTQALEEKDKEISNLKEQMKVAKIKIENINILSNYHVYDIDYRRADLGTLRTCAPQMKKSIDETKEVLIQIIKDLDNKF